MISLSLFTLVKISEIFDEDENSERSSVENISDNDSNRGQTNLKINDAGHVSDVPARRGGPIVVPRHKAETFKSISDGLHNTNDQSNVVNDGDDGDESESEMESLVSEDRNSCVASTNPLSARAIGWLQEIEELKAENLILLSKGETVDIMAVKAENFVHQAASQEKLLSSLFEKISRVQIQKSELESIMRSKTSENEEFLQELIAAKMISVEISSELELVRHDCLKQRKEISKLTAHLVEFEPNSSPISVGVRSRDDLSSGKSDEHRHNSGLSEKPSKNSLVDSFPTDKAKPVKRSKKPSTSFQS